MSLISLLMPRVAHAAEITLSVKEAVYRISYFIINPLIQVGFAVAVLFLVWKIVMYIRDRNSGKIFEAGKDGNQIISGTNGITEIIWGLLGLFIMTSAFFIMRFMASLIGSDIPTP